MKHAGVEYRYVLGSDLVRDGMYVEVSDFRNETPAILEIFYSDATHAMTVSLYTQDVPLDVVEWAIAVAKERLPVVRVSDGETPCCGK